MFSSTTKQKQLGPWLQVPPHAADISEVKVVDWSDGLAPDIVAVLKFIGQTQYGPALRSKLGLLSLEHVRVMIAQGEKAESQLVEDLVGAEVSMKKAEALVFIQSVKDALAKPAVREGASFVPPASEHCPYIVRTAAAGHRGTPPCPRSRGGLRHLRTSGGP